jgi:hypothetical protein
MMNKMTVAAAAGVLALTGTAFGGLGDFQESQTLPFSGFLSPFGPINLTFNQFEEGPQKILKAVELQFNASISANVTAENNNQQAAPEFGVQLTGFVNVDVPAPAPGQLSGSVNLNQQASSGGVAGSDGVPGSGPDFFDFGLLSDSDSGSDTLLMNFGAFVGNGTVDAEVFGQGGFTVTGASSAEIIVSNFQAFGDVTIIYHYNIPTPGAAGLLGLAGFAGLRRRR